MGTTSARALSIAAIGGAVAVLASCDGGSGSPNFAVADGPCSNCTSTGGSAPTPTFLFVENRDAGSVEISIHAAPALRIDRRLIEGSLSVPIPDTIFGPKTVVTLGNQQTANIGNEIHVVSRNAGEGNFPRLGGVIRIGDGPSFLAIGVGKIFIRAGADGKPFFEAEDPKLLSIIPTARSLAACEASKLAAPFDDPPAKLLDGSAYPQGARVISIARDTANCRVFTVEDAPSSTVELRACFDDAIYPFAADATLTVTTALFTGTGGAMTRFSDDAGNTLSLERIGFVSRTATASSPGIQLALDEEPTCTQIQEACGDVDVPARVTAQIADGTIHPVVFGQALPGGSERGSQFVLAASGRPVANLACPRDQSSSSIVEDPMGSVWIAFTTHDPPGP